MAVLLTDEEIAALLSEVKHLPGDYRSKLDLKPKRGHRESELVLPRQAGGTFHVIIRQAGRNLLDFSVILGFTPQGSNRLIRLRRYNGKSHEHTNKIEGARFSGFHVHMATQRYQDQGFREDAFAEPTDRYGDLRAALDCMLRDCSFVAPEQAQGALFDEGM